MWARCPGWGGRIRTGKHIVSVAVSIAFICSTLAGAVGQASAQTPKIGATPNESAMGATLDSRSPLSSTYRISVGDLLDVVVVDVPEFTRSYRVSTDGSISMPMVKEPIPAAGLTLPQLSQAIVDHLITSDLLKEPEVWVDLKESPAQSVTISGAVRNPRLAPVFGKTNLLDIISQAGGLAPDAGRFAVISRVGEIDAGNGGRALQGGSANRPRVSKAITVDLNGLIKNEDPSLNVALYPGDRVTVPPAGLFYVLGSVNRPGQYSLKDAQENVTVLTALAMAGDVTSTAKSKRLVIIRRNPKSPNGREEIPLNLKDILAGRATDSRIQGGDILVVPENGGKKAIRAAIGSALTVATAVTTGVIIYRR